MCGILGLFLNDPKGQACTDLFEGLGYLQHRGQDACGIVTCGPKGRFYPCKGNGMVRDVFTQGSIAGLHGNMGIGHLRYPTAGSSANSEAQPFYVNSPYGIVFGHNGNLTNAPDLKKFLDEDVHRHINTDSDSELLLNIFAASLQTTGKVRVNAEDIFASLGEVYEKVEGAYACVAMLAGFGIIGFRDPYGIRPIILGERTLDNGKKDYMIASESVVLECLDFKNHRNLKPGEAVIIEKGQAPEFRQVAKQRSYAPDLFEYVYFARPDSFLDGISVYRSRLDMGKYLAESVRKALAPRDVRDIIDVVIPVPDTSRESALELAIALQLKYREGFVKNRYVGRTFIMPGQQDRRKNVRRKLNAMELEFKGKSVLIVDDSIVRGTTSREIVQMAREKGAKKVYFASCAPAIRYPHIHGIDLADAKELVAHDRTPEQVADEIGADMVIYQTLEDLKKCVSGFNKDIVDFEAGVFTGDYITGCPPRYLEHLEKLRGVHARTKALEKKRTLDALKINGIGVDEHEVVNGIDEEHIQHKAAEDISLINAAKEVGARV